MSTKSETEPGAYGFLAGALVLLLGLLASDACQCATAAPLKPPVMTSALAEQDAFAVQIATYCDGDAWSTGSGLAIDSRHVLTVLHVAQCPKDKTTTATVTFRDGLFYPMTVEAVVAIPDLVLPGQPDGWARLIKADPGDFTENVTLPTLAMIRDDERVCETATYPKREVNCGDITDTSAFPLFAFTIAVTHGNSGAPIYDSNRKLLGFTISCNTAVPGVCAMRGGHGIVVMPPLLL